MAFLLNFFLLAILVVVMYSLSFLKSLELTKKSDTFECGFNSLNNPSLPFNMPFFYITLMFLIFDLEVALLIFYPLLESSSSGVLYYTLLTLMIILLLTIYEWEKNLINWF